MGLVRKVVSDKNEKVVLERAPRVTITPLHNISFCLQEPFEAPDIRIGNISSTGIGFLIEGRTEHLQDIDVFKGHLVYHGNDSEVKTKQVHCTSRILGCAFLQDLSAVKRVINRYFYLELAAMSLKKVSHRVLKKIPEGIPHWFQKTGDCELYYVEDVSGIVRFNLTFFGNYIEFERGKELVSGRIVDEKPADPGHYEFNEFILTEQVIPPDIAVGAVNFVVNIEGLPSSHEKFICDVLFRSGKIL